MIYKKFICLIFFTAVVLFNGCNKDEGPVNNTLPNESEALIKYLEENGNYINSQPPAFITASEIREGQLQKRKQVVLDLRVICDFNNLGHIEGAVLINLRDIPQYYKENQLDTFERVIITCFTGQSASYAASLLRLQGYKNVYAMLWGMTSWNPVFDSWSYFLSNDFASQFVKTSIEKSSASGLPFINTGKSSAEEILMKRAEDLMSTGFDNISMSNETVFLRMEDYYIINYAPVENYFSGHIPNAVQYSPNQDFGLSTYLKTLPPDKPIAIYCSNGHVSAYAAAYLKLIGYDVKSVLFGNNGMNYSSMSGSKFTPDEMHDYPFVRN